MLMTMNQAEIDSALETGTLSSLYARHKPDATAVYSLRGDRTFKQLNDNINRLARLLRERGLGPEDGIAIMCGNRAEYIEAFSAAMRIGMRITPVNWHLTRDEVSYIVRDCQAKAIVVDADHEEAVTDIISSEDVLVKLCMNGSIEGFDDYHSSIIKFPEAEIENPQHGTFMLYTSGTTGYPKGVWKKNPEPIAPQWAETLVGYEPDTDVNLCCGPAYHAAPLLFDIRWPLASGVPIVFVEKWNTLEILQTLQEYKVTHAHMVPIMFQRLLTLPTEERAQYDLSALRFLLHGAAPCPPEVKHEMIKWVGKIIWEYYGGSEGGSGVAISSLQWLEKPGSVGCSPIPEDMVIFDDDGNELGPNQTGGIYFRSPPNRFSYFNDEEKTNNTYIGDFFTLGDIGHVDEDGYLFLTGRSSECIISGGVNIYPAEIDNRLSSHPAVADSCAVGVPSDQWGEEVKSVVQLKAGFRADDAMKAALDNFARDGLAKYKCPKSFDFVTELPRLPSGKVQRKKVREPYWAGRDKSI
ncbi:MAG: long-chain acyl-CoA synthetase [Planctomycetaceae bacterium]